MDLKFVTFETIDSTNAEALIRARSGSAEGLCIIARQQTAGRGRNGRFWVSESDAGLYFTILLRPMISSQFLSLITLAAGVAVHDTLKEFGLEPDIKWVNDVLVKEKKISGILAETTETSYGLAVVVGIGINIRASNFPPEIADTATSIENETLRTNGTAPSVPSPEQVAHILANYVVHHYGILCEPNGPIKTIENWRRRSTYFAGKGVRVTSGNEIIEGITDGLEPNGALRLKIADGSTAVIQTGDVDRLRTRSTVLETV